MFLAILYRLQLEINDLGNSAGADCTLDVASTVPRDEGRSCRCRPLEVSKKEAERGPDTQREVQKLREMSRLRGFASL